MLQILVFALEASIERMDQGMGSFYIKGLDEDGVIRLLDGCTWAYCIVF